MNDFTKEELIILKKAISDMVLIEGIDSEQSDLFKKISAKISGYCEHDCKDTIWQCQVTACSKCGFPSTLVRANK